MEDITTQDGNVLQLLKSELEKTSWNELETLG